MLEKEMMRETVPSYIVRVHNVCEQNDVRMTFISINTGYIALYNSDFADSLTRTVSLDQLSH